MTNPVTHIIAVAVGFIRDLGFPGKMHVAGGYGNPLDDPLGYFAVKNLVPIKIGPLDMSITMEVAAMFVVVILASTLFILAARQTEGAPRGLRNLLEVFMKWLRDDIVRNFIGKDGDKWVPFIATLFFFILFCNWLGLIPKSSTATANINIPATLAIMVFLLFVGAGVVKHGPLGYIKSLIPHGVPKWLIPLMLPIELVGQVAKPFSLAVRLFANVLAGHIVLVCFLGIILYFNSIIIAPAPLLGVLVMNLLEILFGFIQAYIFTILTAMYIGAALNPEH